MKQKTNYPLCSRWIALAFGLLSGFLPSCANLEAVREFAKTSAATADYQQIVTDYVGSPARQKLYQPARFASTLDEITRARTAQQARLEGAQTVLVQYMSALGDLAADDLPVVDAELEGLSGALTDAKFIGEGDRAISTETATAAGTIAKVLLRAAADHWRQRQIRTIVEQTDASLQTVVKGLQTIVLKDFSLSLDQDSVAVEKYFGKIKAAAGTLSDPDAVQPLARVVEVDHMARIRARRVKLQTYAQVLDQIGKGHAELRRNVGQLKGKALSQRMKLYAQDLRKLYKAFAELQS
ncbi:hypothetical protein [Hymenobacter sp. BT491]|uniref:hypothetical protein n=1 Tax=Hymenobacter sp. BT491 TaxID=2766779 RepID=UPI001653902F|nr:hypothetical protein [Hymenobacter sp. BT491]MBC6991583.1 hypothetical protein [Hymenobacter sp. BT491]